MSMNTPNGQIVNTKPIKDFTTVNTLGADNFLLGVVNETSNEGFKIQSSNFINRMQQKLAIVPYSNTFNFAKGQWCTFECKLYNSLQNDNIGHAVTDTSWWSVVDIVLGNNRNIGQIYFSLLPLTDSCLRLLDGSLINGNGIYSAFVSYMADLYNDNPSANYFTTEALWQQSVANYGVCGKFVYDSVNNTVRLPKITGFIEGTVDSGALGELVQAGLPNITGYTNGIPETTVHNAGGTGAIKTEASGTSHDAYGQGSFEMSRIRFNASWSNSIYGNSATVQPQAIKGFYYIVVATSQKTDIQIDIDEIVTDLNGKINTDLTNFPKPYLKTTYTNGTSGYNIWSNGYCEQWGNITKGSTLAPSSQWAGTISLLKTMANTNYSVHLQANYGTSSENDVCGEICYYSVQTDSFDFRLNNRNTATTLRSHIGFSWRVYGYLAEGEY